jgi:hypothetical protein
MGLAASADELLVKGPRVLAQGNQMIAPTSEMIRYTPNRRLGYHGGLTAQECIPPIAVLAPALMEIEGWEVQTANPPDWWIDSEITPVPEKVRPKRSSKNKERLKPVLSLFEKAEELGDWVDALLASDVFAEQMKTFAGRLKEEQVEQYLRVLADRNLVLLKSAFAQKLGVGLRVDGIIVSLQRILNVESYPVLSVDSSQTIRLNLSLLLEQFELGDSHDG